MLRNCRDYFPVALIGLFLWWAWLVYWPWNRFDTLESAGQFGDSFGVWNSLFTGLAFWYAYRAFKTQNDELHEAEKWQERQQEIQKRQTEVLAETAAIQKLTRDDTLRQVAMNLFLKINQDTMRFRHVALSYLFDHQNKSAAYIEEHEPDWKRNYFEAYTALRSNCLAVGLIFGRDGDALGKLIQSYYDNVHTWVSAPSRDRPIQASCDTTTKHYIHEIEQAMKPLWKRFES